MTKIAAPEYLQGTSLVPLLSNPGANWKKAAYSQFLLGRFGPAEYCKTERMGYAVRTEQYCYIEWYEWDKTAKKPGILLDRELFDHKNDSGENFNITHDKQHKNLVDRLSMQLKNG